MTTPALSAIAAAGPVPSAPAASSSPAESSTPSFQTVLGQQRQQHGGQPSQTPASAQGPDAPPVDPTAPAALPTDAGSEQAAVQLANLQWQYLADLGVPAGRTGAAPSTTAVLHEDADAPVLHGAHPVDDADLASLPHAEPRDDHAAAGEPALAELAAGLVAAVVTPNGAPSATTGPASHGVAAKAEAIRTSRPGSGREPGSRLPIDRAAPELATDTPRQPFDRTMAALPADGTGHPASAAQAAASAASLATGLPAAMMQAPSSHLSAALPGLPVAGAGVHAVPLQHPQWGQTLGHQMLNLTQQGVQGVHTAELRLDPPDLGPLRITISLHEHVAHAVFASPHLQVRQTVEAALPQLQQLFEQAGLSLGQASVNDQSGQDGAHAQGRQGNGLPGSLSGEGDVAVDTATRTAGRVSSGATSLIDTFA